MTSNDTLQMSDARTNCSAVIQLSAQQRLTAEGVHMFTVSSTMQHPKPSPEQAPRLRRTAPDDSLREREAHLEKGSSDQQAERALGATGLKGGTVPERAVDKLPWRIEEGRRIVSIPIPEVGYPTRRGRSLPALRTKRTKRDRPKDDS